MNKILLTAFAAAFATMSFAQISSMTGNIVQIAKPANAGLNQTTNATKAQIWQEGTVTVANGWNLDANGAGNFFSNGSLNGGNIAAGAEVTSYMLHVDSVGSNSLSYDATVTFQQDIIGIIVKDATLNASDAMFGGGTTFYTGTNRGLELSSSEGVLVSVGVKTIRFQGRVTTPLDNVRVFTKAVPEPATMTLVGLGIAAFAARKRKKA